MYHCRRQLDDSFCCLVLSPRQVASTGFVRAQTDIYIVWWCSARGAGVTTAIFGFFIALSGGLVCVRSHLWSLHRPTRGWCLPTTNFGSFVCPPGALIRYLVCIVRSTEERLSLVCLYQFFMLAAAAGLCIGLGASGPSGRKRDECSCEGRLGAALLRASSTLNVFIENNKTTFGPGRHVGRNMNGEVRHTCVSCEVTHLSYKGLVRGDFRSNLATIVQSHRDERLSQQRSAARQLHGLTVRKDVSTSHTPVCSQKYFIPKHSESVVVNLDMTKGPGTHWTAYRKNSNPFEYFDSFGNLCTPPELRKYLDDGKMTYSYETEQLPSQSNCIIDHVYNIDSDGADFRTLFCTFSTLEPRWCLMSRPNRFSDIFFCSKHRYCQYGNLDSSTGKICFPMGSYELDNISTYLRESLQPVVYCFVASPIF
ncbi:hypothetical protein PR048_028388 [Dryococelus australis]|uniref:Apextrin C-terminal domain-containing protein n=1 Tax=Dryococelus australis TaxID=614101 RepID=A0ABQ9GD76_9NEOP|nr:hypothetical protein PR048_028388 [Dryococelus australis]